MSKLSIPTTPLKLEYQRLRKLSQAERLVRHGKLAADPAALAELFRASVAAFCEFDNVEEPFHPGTKVLGAQAPDDISGGRDFLLWLRHKVDETGIWPVVGGPSLKLVDYELRPAHATSVAPRVAYEAWQRNLMLDLLMVTDDHRICVGEVKVSTAKRHDWDSASALIQALAGAAELVSPTQQTRVREHYENFGFRQGPIDVVVINYLPDTPAKAMNKKTFDALAISMAKTLVKTKPKGLGRVSILEARVTKGRMSLGPLQL